MFSWKTWQFNPQFKKDETITIPPGVRHQQCASCFDNIWTPALFPQLSNLADNQRHEQNYNRKASGFYDSLLIGCPWCATIGNAILLSEGLTSLVDLFGLPSGEGNTEETEDEEDSDSASNGEPGDQEGKEPGKAHWVHCTSVAAVRITFFRDPANSLVNEALVKIGISNLSCPSCPFPHLMEDEDFISLKFDISSSAASASDIFPREWGIISPTSPRWVEQAQVWLNKCNYYHDCAAPGGSHPSRLIKVSSSGRARIVSCRGLNSPVTYVALSYVWGPSQPYKLLLSNHDELHAQLDLSRIANTIKDALEVTRLLNFSFIWIDALCIIQDSDQDKANELPKMANIYQDCAMTIIVASASSSEDGFLRPLEPPVFYVDPFTVMFQAGEDKTHSIMLGARSVHQPKREPINTRGWTLQERLLSRKSLIFSQAGVLWACTTTQNSGTGPSSRLRPVTSVNILRDGRDLGDDDLAAIYQYWLEAREDYGSRAMGFYSDKLPAIGGLASVIAERTGWTYLAGMWKERLFHDLHWVCGSPDEASLDMRPLLKSEIARKAGYLAPSWSWASIPEGRILDLGQEEFASPDTTRTPFHFEILDVSVDTSRNGASTFGTVGSGHLRVSGKLFGMRWKQLDDEEWGGIMEENVALYCDQTGEEEELLCAGSLDPLDELPSENAELSLLAMSTGMAEAQTVDGLILAPAGRDDAFRRVGYFRLLDVSRTPPCYSAPTRVIEII